MRERQPEFGSGLRTVASGWWREVSKAEARTVPHEHAVSPDPYKSALVCAICGLLRRNPIHGEPPDA